MSFRHPSAVVRWGGGNVKYSSSLEINSKLSLLTECQASWDKSWFSCGFSWHWTLCKADAKAMESYYRKRSGFVQLQVCLPSVRNISKETFSVTRR